MRVRAVAPVRIADAGGWTDTWFARHGAVCCLAVTPGVEVTVVAGDGREGPSEVHLDLPDLGERHHVVAGEVVGRHPLLEAAIAEADVPDGHRLDVRIGAGVPPGCATGTSAAVTVALLAALDGLTPGRHTADELAAAAHRVETERLGLQSGVQDQLAAAHGGACWIEIDEYPHAAVTQLPLAPAFAAELEARLVLVLLGRPHRSSAVHEQVIARLTSRPGGAAGASELDALRDAARAARDALVAGDLTAYGRALVANTEGQAALHPALVSEAATAVIDAARRHGAAGWKVNGAGGEGGSLTLLAPADEAERAALRNALVSAVPGCRPIDVHLSPAGVTVEVD